MDAQLKRLTDVVGNEELEVVDLPDRLSKARFLHECDVLSVPTSYQEPKGLFVLEALAAGVPVVQPAHGSFPEILERTGGGILVEPGDRDALADALHDLLVEPTKRARLSQEGRSGV